MLKELLEFDKKKQLDLSSKKILLTLSGGVDSTVLFDLFLSAGFDFSVAHCNFSMRGKESEANQKFVEALCKKNKIELFVEKFKTAAFAKKNKISIQMAARQLRYNWFESILKNKNFDCIVTAHHKNDLAETMLINLIRGTGISGLHGILPKNGNLIRPLLFASKSEIENYAAAKKLPFSPDSSNLQDDYVRNKLRHSVMPALKKINPEFEQAFFETAQKIEAAEIVYKNALLKQKNKLTKKVNDEIHFSISNLKKLSPLPIYLFELLKEFGFSASDCELIFIGLNQQSGNQFFSSTHRLLINRKQLVIQKKKKSNNDPSFFIKKSDKSCDLPIALKIKKTIKSKDFKLSKAKNTAQLDLNKITFPLEIRRWQKGDVFQPLGMKGSKKISDFFIDSKLSIFDKEKVWLICSSGKIAWIVNHRISDAFKITPETKNILTLQLEDII